MSVTTTPTQGDMGGSPSLAAALVKTARPRQWIKNAFVLAPLIFSGRFRDAPSVVSSALATAAFTLISIATYFMNDLVDRRFDREHPIKRLRPIAAGKISVRAAVAVSIGLGILGFGLGAWINGLTLACLACYVALHATYSSWLKHKAIVDVLCIALGFVIRVVAGSAAISVEPSSWLLVCTLFLATFLGFAKRSGEAVRLGGAAERFGTSRPALVIYHDRLLLALLSSTCSLTLLSYALYTIERHPPSYILLATIPLVAYALFRYLLLVLRMAGGASVETPESLILRDRGLVLAGLLWTALCVVALAVESGAR